MEESSRIEQASEGSNNGDFMLYLGGGLLFVVVVIMVVMRERLPKIGLDVLKGKLSVTPDSPSGVSARDIQSRTGGVTIEDETGSGATAERVEAEKDVTIRSTGPSSTKKD